ncbi:MAG: hypothetical protein LBS78_01550 [Endomicrobium sp.]|nr:hypothetical protein [Endomicrobium sp.]
MTSEVFNIVLQLLNSGRLTSHMDSLELKKYVTFKNSDILTSTLLLYFYRYFGIIVNKITVRV